MMTGQNARADMCLQNGRRSLAGALMLDSMALSYALLALILSTRIDLIDIALFAAQLVPHLFSATTLYVILRHRTETTHRLLRITVAIYVVALLVDIAVALTRFGLFVAAPADTLPRAACGEPPPQVHLVRIAIALLFVFVDLIGIVFAELTRSTAHLAHLRTNEQLIAYDLTTKV
jgi:hypothetical protein